MDGESPLHCSEVRHAVQSNLAVTPLLVGRPTDRIAEGIDHCVTETKGRLAFRLARNESVDVNHDESVGHPITGIGGFERRGLAHAHVSHVETDRAIRRAPAGEGVVERMKILAVGGATHDHRPRTVTG